MKIKALYIHLPNDEHLRLKSHAVFHGKSIQMVVRNALAKYLSENKIKDKFKDD